jgi:hypothetical protein
MSHYGSDLVGRRFVVARSHRAQQEIHEDMASAVEVGIGLRCKDGTKLGGHEPRVYADNNRLVMPEPTQCLPLPISLLLCGPMRKPL